MKAILVPYHDEEAARIALQTALLLAKRFESYLEGLLVLGEPIVSFVPGMIMPPDQLSALSQSGGASLIAPDRSSWS